MEHFAAVFAKHIGSSHNIKRSKAHIAESERRHKTFYIVISRAGKRFLVHGAVKVHSLPAYFKSMLANVINFIKGFITANKFALVRGRITLKNRSRQNRGCFLTEVFYSKRIPTHRVKIHIGIVHILCHNNFFSAAYDIAVFANRNIYFTAVRFNLQICACGINFVKLCGKLFGFTGLYNNFFLIYRSDFFKRKHRNRCVFYMPFKRSFFGIAPLGRHNSAVIAKRLCIGFVNSALPAFVRGKFNFSAAFKMCVYLRRKPSPAAGYIGHNNGRKLHLNKDAEFFACVL